MATMQAVLIRAPGGPEELYIGDAPRPVATAGQVLIKIHATALNRADTLQRQGRYPPPPGASSILGLECSGEIADSNGSDAFAVGDRVMALLGGGGYAQYTAVDVGCVLRIPLSMSYTDAAAIPEAFLTAYQISRHIGAVQSGETILIHAAASGVGTAAIQLAKHFGAISIATAGSEEKLAVCKALGAAAAFNYKNSAFGASVKEWLASNNNSSGVNVCIDPVGASHFNDNIDVLGLDSRYVVYATMGGAAVNLNLMALMGKRIAMTGTTLRTRSLSYKANLVSRFSSECMAAFVSGELKPLVWRVYDSSNIVEAHQAMEADSNTGKIVITIKH